MTHLYKLTDEQVALIRGQTIDADLRAALDRKINFSNAVVHFSEQQAANEPELTVYADAAPEMSCVDDGVCEIDSQGPVAIVSKGEDAGAYVLAWVWVGDEDAGIETPDEDEDEDEDEDDEG